MERIHDPTELKRHRRIPLMLFLACRRLIRPLQLTWHGQGRCCKAGFLAALEENGELASCTVGPARIYFNSQGYPN